MISVSITQNGVLDLDAGAFQLARLYPALDGVPLQAVKVEVDPRKLSVLWHLEGNRRFRLNITREKDCLRLSPRLEGFPTAPHSVSLFHQSVVKGAQRIWCPAEGMGSGGDTPDFPLAKAKRASGCCALFNDDGQTLGLWVEDQRRFLAQANGLANHLSWVYRTENVPLESGDLELPSLRLAWGLDPWVLLTRMVDAMGQASGVQPRPHRRTWCSWYYYYHHFCRRDLQGVLDGLLSLPDRGGIQEVQIDAGYCRALGDWLEPNHLWPEGLEEAFRAIQSAGFIPGIWVGPFMVGSRSRLEREHPDWILRDNAGNAIVDIRNYGEHRLWHYPDEEYHVLDTSHPEAFAYLREVFKTLHRWGARLFKTDFLYWCMKDSATVRRATPGKTSAEYLRDVMSMIREAIGPESYLLGCIAPHAPCLGLVDGTRIAGDIGPEWSGFFNPQNMLAESLHGMVFNDRWFHTDPDALLVRDFHTGFKPHEVEALALWQTLTSGNICISDPLALCAPERQELWRLCDIRRAPGPARPLHYGRGPAQHVAVRELSGQRWALIAFNPDETPRRFSLSLSEATGHDRVFVRPWRPAAGDAFPHSGVLEADIPSHHARLWLLSLSPDTPLPATLGG